MYYELTKSHRLAEVHPHAMPGRLNADRTVYYVSSSGELPPISYDPRHIWIQFWSAPASIAAAQRVLSVAGYRSFAERTMRPMVRWRNGHYTRPPRQTFRPVPTSPGQLWVRVPVPREFRLVPIPVDPLPSIIASGRKIETIAPVRPAVLSTGNPIWANLPPLGMEKSRQAWAVGDLVYVPSSNLWGRYWGPTNDRHYVELGAVHVPGRPEDQQTRDQHRVGIVPVARCVRPPQR